MSMETEAVDTGDVADPNEMNYIERVEFYREGVHSSLSDQYDTLLSKGCVPRHAAGVLRYIAGLLDIDGRMTQGEVATRYDMTEVTVRKWVDEIEGDIPQLTQKVAPPSQRETATSAQSSSGGRTAAREIYHLLYTSPDPVLLTPTIREQSGYRHNHVLSKLRDLAKMEAVGGRFSTDCLHNPTKEWWAVARCDTPGYHYDSSEDPHTHPDLF